jgi:hypothetical protein
MATVLSIPQDKPALDLINNAVVMAVQRLLNTTDEGTYQVGISLPQTAYI